RQSCRALSLSSRLRSPAVLSCWSRAYRSRRALHSFPTRRSSDLTYAGTLTNLAECEGNPRLRFVRGDIRDPRVVGEVMAGDAGRSEEHTSELQSRENLVCRLLLEKKKENTRPDNLDLLLMAIFRA